MKKISLITLIIILSINSYAFGQGPSIDAESAILMDAKSGRVLLEYNPHIRLPMASTTKIMTALIALENGNLKENVNINQDVVGIEGSSIYLCDKESISLEDLVYGLMLRSGNDASMAIANYIGEDLQGFVNMMNVKAKELGANNTNFINPHGLPDENHYSSAYDLALITKEAMKIDKFKEVVSTKTWESKRDKNNIFYNKNKTLWEYEGGDGVKTGYTKRAGRCLVSSATKKDIQFISVVLNDQNWFADCYKLMDYGFENFNTYVIFEKGQYIDKISIDNGVRDSLTVVTKESFSYPFKEEELKNIKIHIDLPQSMEAPIKKESNIGNITVYLDGKIIYKENLIAKESVKRLGFIKRVLGNS